MNKNEEYYEDEQMFGLKIADDGTVTSMKCLESQTIHIIYCFTIHLIIKIPMCLKREV